VIVLKLGSIDLFKNIFIFYLKHATHSGKSVTVVVECQWQWLCLHFD